jgi:hypothetical protein
MVIDDIEYHEDYLLVDNLDLKSACPIFLIIAAWAYERNLLAKDFVENSPFYENYKKFTENKIGILDFVSSALDGVILKEYFVEKCGDFVEDYFINGLPGEHYYYEDLMSFFDSHYYKLPNDWDELKKFFHQIDSRYEEYVQAQNKLGV